jgi:hypothetical protein
MALDTRKLLLALAGVLVFAFGLAVLSRLPFASPPPTDQQLSPWLWVRFEPVLPTLQAGREAEPLLFFHRAARSLEGLLLLPQPIHDVVGPGSQVFRRGNTWSEVAWAWTRLLWALIVWAVFGGAIARIAALEIAGKGSPSLRESLRHSTRYLISSLGGPLLPIVGIGCFWIVAAGLGLVGLIPGIGPLLVGSLWFLPLICGAFLAVILIGIGVAWPLMYCTISTEGSDAFDALSRAYSYIFGRPWYALWIALATAVYASIVTSFLFLASEYAVDLASWAVAGGMGDEKVDAGMSPLPGTVAAHLVQFWMRGLGTLLVAYTYSYFWTAATIAYFLLRHAEDATPFNHAYWPEPVPDGPALSGIAAAERREQTLAAESAGSATAGVAAPGDEQPARTESI